MSRCRICGQEASGYQGYTCSYCGRSHCQSHRLPENHDCPFVSTANTLGPEFREYDDSPQEQDTTSPRRRRWRGGGSRRREKCNDCGNYTKVGNDLCARCRRRSGAISSSSPDVTADGKVHPGPDVIRERHAGSGSAGEQPDRSGSAYRRATSAFRSLTGAAAGLSVPRIILLGLVIASVWIVALGGPPVDDVGDRIEGAAPSFSLNTSALVGESGVDTERVEDHVHDLVNEERSERRVNGLESDPQLREMARDHSRDMVEREFFSHTNPDGQGVVDRYRAAGYSCELGGGENLAQTWYDERVLVDSDTERYTDEEELAEAIVEMWMESPGHRDNLLHGEWRKQGIGVAMDSDGRVYATQKFC